MKKSILTLVFAVAAIACFSGSVKAQASKAKADSTQVKSFTAQEKESVLTVISVSRNTLLKSSNQNTTEQNLDLLNKLQEVINFLNERMVVGSKPVDPSTSLRVTEGDRSAKGETKQPKK